MKHQAFAILLAFSCILQLSTIQLVNAYTFNGYELKDLNDDSVFETDASQWTTSSRRTTDIYSTCDGTKLVGGFGVLGTASTQLTHYFQRVYSGLPEHKMIYYSVTFWALDTWDASPPDSFSFKFDSTLVNTWTMDFGWFAGQLCGTTYPDAKNIRIFGTTPHSKSTLTFQVLSNLDSESENESFGFRDLTFLFDQSGTSSSTSTICGLASFNIASNCPCPEGQYNNGGTCTICHGNCASCYGGSNSQCYECKKNSNVFWDGRTCATCAEGCSFCSGSLPTQCLKCAAGYYYVPWINQCFQECPYPLVKTTDANGNPICSSPCPVGQFIYWDRSCLATCAAPLQQSSVISVIKTCRHPCSPVEYLFWDGTCQQDCWAPLTVRVARGVQFCDYPCSLTANYLSWDGRCLETCEAPFISRMRNARQFCHPPCDLSYYLYPDNTCQDTCTGAWTSRPSGGITYCDFRCGDSEFYYWDGRCLTSCDFPLHQRYEHGKAYCDYPTDVNDYLYWDGTSSTNCDYPLTARPEGTPIRKYCDYTCDTWDYMYWDRSCVNECNFPLQPRVQNGRKFCDFGCADQTKYLYWNGSCVDSTTGCTMPFILRPEYSRYFCDSPPATSSSGGLETTAPELFYYWDGSSATECASPLKQRIEGSTKYCDYKCTNPLDFLYWNGSCINSCDPPLTSDPSRGKNFCKYKCSSDKYLHTNGTCLSVCDSPYVKKIYGTDKFCFDACITSTDFYYWNNTCHPDCPSPLQQQTLGSINWCIYPCLSNQFLLNDGSCIETCDLPLSMKIESGAKYCTNPCATGEYLFLNGTCVRACDAPLRIKDGNLCILPCDNQLEYYDEQTGKCVKECSSSSLKSDDLYLRCLAPEILIDNGSLLDIFLKTPQPGEPTLVAVPSGLEYVRYVGMKMPPRLSNFTISKGRNILSLRFGQRMSEDMRSMFSKRTLLASIAEQYATEYSFIVNLWEDLTSLTIMVTAAMFVSIFEQIFKSRGWITLQKIFEKIKVITRWNFCLVLVATNVGNIIFFSVVEFKSPAAGSSFSALSLELCLIMIGAVIALIIAVVWLVQRLQLAKRKCAIYNSREEFEKFQTAWQGYQILFRGFRSDTLLNQHFLIVYIVRLSLPMFIASVLSISPVTQTTFYILINLTIIFYLLLQKPLIRRINHIQLLIVEVITLVINSSLLGLAILDANDSVNTHLISGLGDLVVGSTSCINLVAIVFLFIKVADGTITIFTHQKSQKNKDFAVYLQILVFFVQQGGMGFEEIFVDEEAARIFNHSSKLLQILRSKDKSETQMLLREKARGMSPAKSTKPNNEESQPRPSNLFTTPDDSHSHHEEDLSDPSNSDNTSNSLLKLHILRNMSKHKGSIDNSLNATNTAPLEETSLIKLHSAQPQANLEEVATPKSRLHDNEHNKEEQEGDQSGGNKELNSEASEKVEESQEAQSDGAADKYQ